ncbi:L-amino acid N-acyltransferase YncA [Tenacibaculum sp. MAR_2009_124]|uniref:GNAT family N-acetyltransferase n=1 Tax=Tenacibaculum sp. MAR_2009_124 TaxID=1250059 RepID=UPI00089970CA|nr:GNAT family N-acetyltransferase [Tenacibaculum sp. MAR_2009_124]SEB81653.1 L-amino acid N-acyltransferase YncA [Tenacibaculum sp. MAR_2009_124]
MNIRKAQTSDYDEIWELFSEVIKTEDSYVFKKTTPKKDLKKHWFAPYMETYVIEGNGKILGTYIIKPNQIGLGKHIANCSYMVHPNTQGKGVGKKLCEHSINVAQKESYKGIQFNIVVSTNKAAIALWKKFGFKIIGTTPNGYKHSTLGYVDTYIMFKQL